MRTYDWYGWRHADPARDPDHIARPDPQTTADPIRLCSDCHEQVQPPGRVERPGRSS